MAEEEISGQIKYQHLLAEHSKKEQEFKKELLERTQVDIYNYSLSKMVK